MVTVDDSIAPDASRGDEDLRGRLVARDGAALALAYDIHAGVVYGIARRVTGSGALAEDVVQEVFFELWERPERFDPRRGRLRTYVAMLAHRRAVDRVRSEVSRQSRERRFGSDSVSAGTIEDQVVARDDASWARRSLASLPDEQRKCIELAYFSGLTFREVAEHLGIAEGTAKSRIRLGLKRLHLLLTCSGKSANTQLDLRGGPS